MGRSRWESPDARHRPAQAEYYARKDALERSVDAKFAPYDGKYEHREDTNQMTVHNTDKDITRVKREQGRLASLYPDGFLSNESTPHRSVDSLQQRDRKATPERKSVRDAPQTKVSLAERLGYWVGRKAGEWQAQ